MNFKTYMRESKPVTRMRIMNVFLAGMMSGAALGIIIGLGASIL